MPPLSLLFPLLALLPAPLLFYFIGHALFGTKRNTRQLGIQTGILLLLFFVFFAILRWGETNESSVSASVGKTKTLPKLSEIGLADWELIRWDGSTSLRPLADLIVSRLTGVPIEQMANSEIEFWPRHRFSKTHDSIVNVIEGRRDLVFSARKPSEDESKLAEEMGVELVCTPFARDAFVFLVHPNNPVENLSREQLRAVYEGSLTSWSEAVGRDVRIDPPLDNDLIDWAAWGYPSQENATDVILPLVRNRNSGSEELMRELVMVDALVHAKSSHVVKTMAGIFNALEVNANAIGYSLLYFEKRLAPQTSVRLLSVDGIPPSPETVASGTYPYVYECYLIHRESPGGKTERFVHWLLEPEGRETVFESGYVPGTHSP